jgi:hypothetical protein
VGGLKGFLSIIWGAGVKGGFFGKAATFVDGLSYMPMTIWELGPGPWIRGCIASTAALGTRR